MKKKLSSLLLAMLLAASCVLGGCSDKAEGNEEITADTEEASRLPMTLTLWIPTSKNTTDEAILAVQDAINAITQARFDTAIELHAIPEDEYQKAVDDRMQEIIDLEAAREAAEKAAREEAKKLKEAGIETEPKKEEESDTSETEEETYRNELGISLKKYPVVEDDQMDIFLVQGYDKYMYYIDEGLIQQLDAELSSTSKILKTYIYPMFLNLAKQGGTYAIPNNRPLGEYEYLLLNKELIDRYGHDPLGMTSLEKCNDFIMDLGYQIDYEGLEGVVPLLDTYDLPGMVYWTEDGSWSIFASQIPNTTTETTSCPPRSIFENNAYRNNILYMKEYMARGYVGDGTVEEGQVFGVGVVKGDYSVREQYEEDYYINIYSRPKATAEDIFGNMFAVSSYSKSLARSMEIITYLNTEEDLRTVLQYGVEGEHWKVDPENRDTIVQLSDDYQMDLYATGNVYMTYPDYGKTIADWDYAKMQNRDAVASPYMYWSLENFFETLSKENKALLGKLETMSEKYADLLDTMSYEEIKAAMSDWRKEIKADQTYVDAMAAEGTGPYGTYMTYYADNIYVG